MKKYTIRFRMSGKELKSFTTGADFIADDKLYDFTWTVDGFKNYLKGWWGIIRRTPHSLTILNEESQ